MTMHGGSTLFNIQLLETEQWVVYSRNHQTWGE
jgi:hypothetical protein